MAIELDANSAISGTSAAPFAQVAVTLTKLEHVQLVMEARSWKSLHQRAVSRLQQLQDSTKRFVAQLREHAERREATLRAALALAHEAATQREAALRAEFDEAQAKVRDLQQRLFGRKSERSKGASELQPRPGYQPAAWTAVRSARARAQDAGSSARAHRDRWLGLAAMPGVR